MGARRDVTVKIAADLAKDAKIVAAFRDLSLAEYLSETLRPLVAGDLKKELLERSAEHLPKLELPRDGEGQEASASG
jgi:hypothetical protein